MTVAERLYRWNSWYDELPQEWRFQFILWPLIALGACNILLSLSIRFPFGLLVLIGILCVTAVRVPYALGWITPAEALPSGEPGTRRLEIGGAGADWLVGLNQRYEAMPEKSRFWVFPTILLIAGAINMLLTINRGYPFGLIFLLALLALIVMRAPYAGGMLRSPSSSGTTVPALQFNARIADAHSPVSPNADSAERAAAVGPALPVPPREMRAADPNETTMSSVDADAASQPDVDHHTSASLSPAAPAEPVRSQEPEEARVTSSPPAPAHEHPQEPKQT